MTAEEKELWDPSDLSSNPAPPALRYMALDASLHSSHISVSPICKIKIMSTSGWEILN